MYTNHDPVMTLAYFKASSTRVVYTFELGKLLNCHLKGKSAGNLQMDRRLIILKKKEEKKMAEMLCTGAKYQIQTCLLVYAADLR